MLHGGENKRLTWSVVAVNLLIVAAGVAYRPARNLISYMGKYNSAREVAERALGTGGQALSPDQYKHWKAQMNSETPEDSRDLIFGFPTGRQLDNYVLRRAGF